VNEYFDLPTIDERACNGCGACCMSVSIPPFWSYDDDDYDFQVLPEHLKREIRSHLAQVSGHATPDSPPPPCIWLDMTTRKCRHYEYRPFCCREFRPGSDVCLDDRRLRGIDPPLN